MSRGFEDINYRLRPAKNVQRKMIVDLLQQLRNLHPLDNYRYIGFGSPYFSDIKLIHKRLHIDDIVSIEWSDNIDSTDAENNRFELNKPFDCVQMKYGRSKEILPELSWDDPVILWLDYVDELEKYMFSDIREFMTNAVAGSVIFITMNAHPDPLYSLEEDETMLKKLNERLGRDYVPEDVEQKDVRGWGYGDVCRRIINNQIKEKFIPVRNKGRSENETVEYQQLINFKYEDGAKMRTIGGLLQGSDTQIGYDYMNLDSLSFIRTGSDTCKIDTPVLTFAEMRYLDKMLPADPAELEAPVPNRHIKNYSKLYRYFPHFVESEL